MTRNFIVVATAAVALAAFALAGVVYNRNTGTPTGIEIAESSNLVRPHSPVIGPPNAPVTIVEFFDPSCETCRAMYPFVKRLMAKHPEKVRLVLRYAPFHEGSDQAVKLLEAARLQNLFVPVLEALLAEQPTWAIHGAPNLNMAWVAARAAGLDVDRAKADAEKPEHEAVLKQDLEDIKSIKVTGTPTFFVNGKALPKFGAEELAALVEAEVKASR